MADKPNMISVQGTGDNRKIVLYEQDEAHPNGQALVANTIDKKTGKNEVHRVAETATVKRLLAEGVLVKAGSAPTEAPKAPAVPKKE